MKKIYMILAAITLLSMSLNAQQLKVDQFGNVPQPKAKTEKGNMKAPNRADVLLPGCSWDVSTNGTTLPTGWTTTSNLSTNSDGSAYINSSSGGTITIPSSLLQGNSTVKVVINAASYTASTYSLSVNNSAKQVYETSFSDYTWENVSATNGITITMNSWNVSLMSIKVYATSNDPFITATPNSITIQCAPNGTASETVAVTGLNLTGNISATISGTDASLFSVSPASLGTSGGELTVTYSPTAVGTHTATLTLSSTGADPVTISLNGSCALKETICDGTNENGFLPIYGYYIDDYQINQMIYPEITSLIGKKLTSMTFYATTALDTKLSSVGWNVKLGTTTQNSFANALSSITRLVPDDVTTVAEGYVITSGINTMTITFTTPFEYNGGNLLVDFQSTAEGQYASASFYGVDQSTFTGYNSYRDGNATPNQNGHYSGGGVRQFLPKVTFEYEETGPKIVVSPETLTINDSGTNNTFTVQGTNLVDNNNGNVGVSASSSDFGLTFSSSTNTIQSWGFERNNGSVNGTVAVNYYGRALNATTTVTAATQGDSKPVDVTYVADLYIVTDNGVTGNWDFTNGTQMTNNDGVYTATFTATVDNTYILFARKLGESNPWNTRYVFGPDSGGDWAWGTYTGGNIDVNDDDPIVLPAGTYTVTINANDGTFTITKLVPDLAIALDAPAQVVGGNDATVTATVTNTGETPVTGYTVTITADGNTILTQTVNETLAVGATNELTVQYPTTAAQVGNTVNFAANVAYTDDGDATNNNATASMSIINMPAPENVVAVADSENQSATVTWDAPSNLPIQSVTEGFEDTSVFPPFSAGGVDATTHTGAFGDWTLYDATGGCIVYGSKEINFEHEGEPHAWFVFKPSEATADQDYPNAVAHDSYSGAQYLESICPTSSSSAAGVSDHWLISPELSGNAQTISFYVSELTTIWGDETYEIWVSTSNNTAPASFTKLGNTTYTVNHDTWEEQTVQLPAGTKYFAIRHTSNDIFGLLIDDLTYEGPLNPVSYNVYLNGVLQGSVDANDPLTYDFTNLSAGDYTVEISAVYPGGIESAKESDTFTIVGKTPTPTITYETTNATVVVTATGEGTVYLEVDGRVVSGEGSVSITIMRSLEDRTVTATATAVAPNSLPSAEATSNVPVPALAGGPAQAKEGLLRMHLLVVDQMKEPIPADNSHPDRYGYVLKWEQPANTADRKQSGTVEVDIQKTEAQVNGYYTLDQIDADVNIGINHDQGLTMDVLTADVGMFLPGENPDVLYYQMQGKQGEDPELNEDYLTQLQYMKNVQKYEEMLATSPNKTHQYPANETYHYYDDSTPIVTGIYNDQTSFITYAPSVSTWGIQRRYFEEDGLDNTYGAPIWKTAVGKVELKSAVHERQKNQWNSVNWTDAGGNACSLYILKDIVAEGYLPHTGISNVEYEPYMFRVFVESKNGKLRPYTIVPQGDGEYDGEHLEAGTGTTTGPLCVWSGYCMDGDVNGMTFSEGTSDEPTTSGQTKYTFTKAKVDREGISNPWNEYDTIKDPETGEVIDIVLVNDRNAANAMFGALDNLAEIIGTDGDGKPIYATVTEDDLKVFVRFYYVAAGTADGHTLNTRAGGASYPAGYGTESPGKAPSPWTSVNELQYHGEIVGQTYYNVQGMQSDRPFEGVNIIVTRYSDGSTSVSKVVK